jgi:hypothetical protein
MKLKILFLGLGICIGILFMASTTRSDAFKYDGAGRRDPFVPLVGAERPVNAGLENITSVDDIKLEGIALSPQGKSRAILNGEMVKENDRIGGLEIKKIKKKGVIIIFGGTEHTLTLSEEGGNPGGK